MFPHMTRNVVRFWLEASPLPASIMREPHWTLSFLQGSSLGQAGSLVTVCRGGREGAPLPPPLPAQGETSEGH